jgi:hypothetical protein
MSFEDPPDGDRQAFCHDVAAATALSVLSVLRTRFARPVRPAAGGGR